MSKQKQKPKKRWWVSRDRTGTDFYQVCYTNEKPIPIAGTYTCDAAVLIMNAEEFREVFVLRIRKGACKEIERPELILKKKGK